MIRTKILLMTVLWIGALSPDKTMALGCGDPLVSDVTLSGNLSCGTGYVVFEVLADGITIDLNGYTISGVPSMGGISISGYNNVTVKNGAITGVFAGVNTSRSDELHVQDVVFYDVGHGVILSSSNKALIEQNDFIRTRSDAVWVRNSVAGYTASNNTIADNEFFQARIGVSVCGDDADANTIEDNLIWQSQDYGIQIIQSDQNIIEDNRILETDEDALVLTNASYNQMQGNSLRVGRVGLSINAYAGRACLATGDQRSYKNSFTGSHSIGFDVGALLGLGASADALVLKNALRGNKLYDNDVGIRLNMDAHDNDGRDNAYSGTIPPVDDLGMGNIY